MGGAYRLIASLVTRHEEAVLPDHRLVGEGHRYPWCVESPGDEVAGNLLWLRRPVEALEIVDRYEGVDTARPEYRRAVVTVLTVEGRTQAWAYVGGPWVPPGAETVEGGDWLRDR